MSRRQINPSVLVTKWDKEKNIRTNRFPVDMSEMEEKHVYQCSIRFAWLDLWKVYRPKTTQAKCYDLTGIHPQSIGRFDRGVSSPTLNHVLRLCEYVAKKENRSTIDILEEYYAIIEKYRKRFENEIRSSRHRNNGT